MNAGQTNRGPISVSATDEISTICRRTFQLPDAHGVVGRTFHRKTHVFLKATLTIPGNLPEEIAHGLFASPRTFEAWVRFSPSLFSSDRKPDAQGMAVKLLDVPGATCRLDIPGEHDLVLINQPAFLFADEAEALDYFRKLDGCGPLTSFNVAPPGFVVPGPDPRRIRWRFVWLMLDVVRQTLSCLDLTRLSYFSTTPYRLGKGAMKFAFQPKPAPKARLSGTLRNRFKQRLAMGPIRFDFLIQYRTLPAQEPLDDATRCWTSPQVTAGLLEIPVQDFETEEYAALAERISYSPWNCLKSHEPLGSINRLRRTVYQDAAENRSATFPLMGLAKRPADLLR